VKNEALLDLCYEEDSAADIPSEPPKEPEEFGEVSEYAQEPSAYEEPVAEYESTETDFNKFEAEPALDTEPVLETEPAVEMEYQESEPPSVEVLSTDEPGDYSAADDWKPEKKATANVIVNFESEQLTCGAGETAPVKVKITGLDGRPVSFGIPVKFEIIEEPGGISGAYFLHPSGIEGEKVFEIEPDLSGEAVSNIIAPPECGRFTVVVTAEEDVKQLTVNVAPGVPSSIEVTASAQQASPGEDVDVSAKILDKYGNPVPGEFLLITPSNFVGQSGTVEQAVNQSDENGEVRAVYKTSDHPGDSATMSATNPNVGAFAVKTVKISVVGDPNAKPQKAASKKPDVSSLSDVSLLSEEPAFAMDVPLSPPMQNVDLSAPIKPAAEAGPAPAAPAAQKAEEPRPSEQEILQDYMHDEEPEVDEYLKEMAQKDPYLPPAFDIKRGKKPVMELSSIMPKLLKIGAIIGIVLVLIIAALLSYRTVMYQYYFNRAMMRYIADDHGAALMLFEKAASLDPTKVDAVIKKSEILIKEGEKALDRNDVRSAEQQFDLAIKAADKALQVEPNNLDLLYLEGQAYEGKGSYCNAYYQYKRVLKVDPKYEAAVSKSKDQLNKCNKMKRMRWR
ncbi:MAG TPA: hypothetical protein PLQ76_07070, partial [bacterium]|nr:hypothetical protein [bacterium]